MLHEKVLEHAVGTEGLLVGCIAAAAAQTVTTAALAVAIEANGTTTSGCAPA
jgi:hypothetical protein